MYKDSSHSIDFFISPILLGWVLQLLLLTLNLAEATTPTELTAKRLKRSFKDASSADSNIFFTPKNESLKTPLEKVTAFISTAASDADTFFIAKLKEKSHDFCSKAGCQSSGKAEMTANRDKCFTATICQECDVKGTHKSSFCGYFSIHSGQALLFQSNLVEKPATKIEERSNEQRKFHPIVDFVNDFNEPLVEAFKAPSLHYPPSYYGLPQETLNLAGSPSYAYNWMPYNIGHIHQRLPHFNQNYAKANSLHSIAFLQRGRYKRQAQDLYIEAAEVYNEMGVVEQCHRSTKGNIQLQVDVAIRKLESPSVYKPSQHNEQNKMLSAFENAFIQDTIANKPTQHEAVLPPEIEIFFSNPKVPTCRTPFTLKERLKAKTILVYTLQISVSLEAVKLGVFKFVQDAFGVRRNCYKGEKCQAFQKNFISCVVVTCNKNVNEDRLLKGNENLKSQIQFERKKAKRISTILNEIN